MKKYYIGFFVLLGLCVAAVVYTASQGASAKVDKQTDQPVEEFANKVGNNYNLTAAPASLAAAGVKNPPSTVNYTKLNSTSYKICFTYKNSAGGFDAGWSSLFTGGLSSQSSNNGVAQDGVNSNGGYFDASVESIHKKGQNCQTVKIDNFTYPSTDILNNKSSNCGNSDLTVQQAIGCGISPASNSTSSSNACDNYSVSYPVVGSATVSSVDTTNKQITFNSLGQSITDDSGNTVTISTLSYNSNTVFCDANAQPTDITAIKPGLQVFVYLSSASAITLGEVELYQ